MGWHREVGLSGPEKHLCRKNSSKRHNKARGKGPHMIGDARKADGHTSRDEFGSRHAVWFLRAMMFAALVLTGAGVIETAARGAQDLHAPSFYSRSANPPGSVGPQRWTWEERVGETRALGESFGTKVEGNNFENKGVVKVVGEKKVSERCTQK